MPPRPTTTPSASSSPQVAQRRPIRPIALLGQADELSGRGQGTAGRPKNIDLRRALSAAYYALYHSITLSVAAQLSPNAHREDRWALTRGVSHSAVLDVCRWILQAQGGPERLAGPIAKVRRRQDIKDVATTFIDLQAARHEADYDHLANFSKATVLSQIDAARDAVRVVGDYYEDSADEGIELFLAMIALHSRAC